MRTMAMGVVSKNKIISLSYIIRSADGDVLEYQDLPVSYLQGGESEMLPVIEEALEGREVGERVKVCLSADEAFGRHDPSLQFSDDLDSIPEEFRKLGAEFEAVNENGEVMQFSVVEINESQLVIDGNHPLAGRNLEFDITITGVREPTTEELIDFHISEHTPQTLQ